MKMPKKEELPIRAGASTVLIDKKRIDLFHQAFLDKKNYLPPTLYAVAMKGVFDLVNQFEVDWRNLLHATQSFEYHSKLEVPVELSSETSLVDIKERAGFYWLQFRTESYDSKDSAKNSIVSSKTLLMVKNV